MITLDFDPDVYFEPAESDVNNCYDVLVSFSDGRYDWYNLENTTDRNLLTVHITEAIQSGLQFSILPSHE